MLEIYRFLASEVKAYLPHMDVVTIYHLRDLASGKRTRIHCDDVKVLIVPHYEGLTITTMLTFAQDYPTVSQCLPSEPREVLKLPRDYVANIIHTLVGEPFAQWVQAQVQARNAKIAAERDMMVDLDPEIATLFNSSTAVSGR